MAWTKSPQSLVDLFADALPDDPRIERRKMFGYPAIFVGGNMCAGLFQDRMFARLAPADADALPGGAQPFEPMPGRAMKGYAHNPDDILADEDHPHRDAGQSRRPHGRPCSPKEKKLREEDGFIVRFTTAHPRGRGMRGGGAGKSLISLQLGWVWPQGRPRQPPHPAAHSSSADPVSSRLFRLARMLGHPVETASMNFEGETPIV